MIRATFYNHFEDKYAALDYIADELLHEEQKVFVASKDIVHVDVYKRQTGTIERSS